MKACEVTGVVPCKCGKFSQRSLPCVRIKALRWQGRGKMEVLALHSREEAQQEEGVELPRESSRCHLYSVENKREPDAGRTWGPSLFQGKRRKGGSREEQSAVGGGMLRAQCLEVLSGAYCRGDESRWLGPGLQWCHHFSQRLSFSKHKPCPQP